jgi:hypothetical protein
MRKKAPEVTQVQNHFAYGSIAQQMAAQGVTSETQTMSASRRASIIVSDNSCETIPPLNKNLFSKFK